MGEHQHRPTRALAKLQDPLDQAQVVDTLGGRMHVRWDESANATPHGQLVYFTEFLATTGVFDRWVSSCPLYLTPMHGKTELLKTLIANIRAALQYVKDTAEQFKSQDPWALLVRYVSNQIAPTLRAFRLPELLAATG